jgi:hypothetical protein
MNGLPAQNIALATALLSCPTAMYRGVGGGFFKTDTVRPKDKKTKQRRKANQAAAKSRKLNRGK